MWDQEYWNNTVGDYVMVLGFAILVWGVIFGSVRLVCWRLKPLLRPEKLARTLLWNALRAVRASLLFGVCLLSAMQHLKFSGTVKDWLHTFVVALIAIQFVISANRAISAWLRRYESENLAELGSHATTMRMLLFVLRLFIGTLAFLIAFDNIPGIDITTLVAGLGIGGIAVALAVQSILSDMFASMTIALDKPFVIGDFIAVGEEKGVVQHIGLKTTRVRALSGEQLVFSNNDLLTSRIRNYKHMLERRVEFKLTAAYNTPLNKVRLIAPKLRELIDGMEQTRCDRVHFASLGPDMLEFVAVYFVKTPDFNVYMDCQQALNLAIHEFFEEQGIEFPFPTQTLYLRQDDPAIREALSALVASSPRRDRAANPSELADRPSAPVEPPQNA